MVQPQGWFRISQVLFNYLFTYFLCTSCLSSFYSSLFLLLLFVCLFFKQATSTTIIVNGHVFLS